MAKVDYLFKNIQVSKTSLLAWSGSEVILRATTTISAWLEPVAVNWLGAAALLVFQFQLG
jgi:hypothetical protein